MQSNLPRFLKGYVSFQKKGYVSLEKKRYYAQSKKDTSWNKKKIGANFFSTKKGDCVVCRCEGYLLCTFFIFFIRIVRRLQTTILASHKGIHTACFVFFITKTLCFSPFFKSKTAYQTIAVYLFSS